MLLRPMVTRASDDGSRGRRSATAAAFELAWLAVLREPLASSGGATDALGIVVNSAVSYPARNCEDEQMTASHEYALPNTWELAETRLLSLE